LKAAERSLHQAAHQVPADARAAASVLLLRDGAAGPEVLMMRRAERAGDARSGAAVFPGGVLDARDRDAHACCLGGDDAALSAQLGVAEGGLDYAVAVLRECFEEVGLLIADRELDAAAAFPWRDRLQRGEASALDFCRAFDLRLDVRGLVYHSHWLTPPGTARRFDTRFFIARAPASQQAVADYGEAQELMWLTPAAALEPARGLKLLPVTQRTLGELACFDSVDAALAAARERCERRQIRLIMPRIGRSAGGARAVVLPHEWAYAEIGRLDAEGRGDVLAQIVAGRPVRLSPNVVRVTAPNAGMMTGPGTNSYLVGADDAWTVIDPGPADAAHLQALLGAAPGRITRILVTHTHVDHSPGALALAAATGAPLWGRVARHAQGQDSSFVPAHEPAHGERLMLAPGVTLRVLHTPGHASNHLCYLFEEEKLLFTGDHVMQGSTVVINPPDGDMLAYLNALRALQHENLQWLAPGHGFLVGEPQAVLQGLIAHRLQREARVVDALQRLAPAAIETLLPDVYADVAPQLHAMARRSLLAHLLKLQADGRAEVDQDEVWRAT
jgi:glyoxylase-like metal-dependent hydrolase (beta-lactamase superfamily II)/8-oxo-dGTP pyrophosphatase MutT (NUDIX family)